MNIIYSQQMDHIFSKILWSHVNIHLQKGPLRTYYRANVDVCQALAPLSPTNRVLMRDKTKQHTQICPLRSFPWGRYSHYKFGPDNLLSYHRHPISHGARVTNIVHEIHKCQTHRNSNVYDLVMGLSTTAIHWVSHDKHNFIFPMNRLKRHKTLWTILKSKMLPIIDIYQLINEIVSK